MTRRAGHRRAPAALLAATLIIGCYTAAAAAAAIIPGLDNAGQLLAVGIVFGSLAGAAAWLASPRLGAPRPPILPAPPIILSPEATRLTTRLRFDRQLDRALDGVGSEAATFEVTTRALEMVPPHAPTELLMASKNGGRIMQVAEFGPDGEGPGCPVAAAGECHALRKGRIMRFDADDALDACPHLQHRLGGPCSAVCVPVRVLGEPVGVLHRTRNVGDAPDDIELGYLESLATKLETRLSLLQVTARAQVAPLDPHTGVYSRDGLEKKIFDLARELTPFCVAQADIDSYGDYVDRHGDAAGEAALRKVGQALLAVLRPTEVVGRCGIDELLVVFPDTSALDASRALERVREHLALALVVDSMPPFTVSFGVAESGFGRSLDELLVEADVAVSLAKDLGRNRVVVAGELITDPMFDDE